MKASKSILLIFSHNLTPEQEEDLKNNWEVRKILYLPKELQDLWSNIPPDLEEIDGYLDPLKRWIRRNSSAGDLVLVQGDFGAVYIIVNFCFGLGLVPIYSTTERVAKESTSNGKVITSRVFQHRKFRIYEK